MTSNDYAELAGMVLLAVGIWAVAGWGWSVGVVGAIVLSIALAGRFVGRPPEC